MSEISLQPLVETAINVVMDSNNLNLTYKVNDQRENNFPSPDEHVDNNNTIQCYVNQDNTLSFINNSNVFQTVEDDCGEIYYACIGPNDNDNITNQDQVLQLIPQNQISNYIISDKDYSNVNYINESVSYYDSHNATQYNTNNKYPYDNLDSTVYKSSSSVTTASAAINNGKQICEICSVEFPSKRTYLKHMSIHENDREFKCSWCKLSYNYEVNLLVHVAIIHTNECTIVSDDSNQEMSYKCAICSCLFSRKKAHQAHCLIHQVDEELPCEHCSALFKCKVLLDKHLNDHKINGSNGNNGENIGELCDERKLTINYLKCKICHDIFENVGNVKKHYIRCHPKTTGGHWPIEKPVDIIAIKSEDKTTDAIETEEKPNKRKSSKIACQTIKLYAQGKTQLEEPKPDGNRMISKRGRPKKTEPKLDKSNCSCAVCGKSFKTPILLRRHEVTHTGIKEFECPICKKGFTQKSSVKIHMVVHENVKGFSCQFCEKAFTYEHNMNTHIKVIHKNGNEVLSSQSQLKQQQQQQLLLLMNESNEEKEPNRLLKSTGSITETNQSATDDAEISQYLWNDNLITNENNNNNNNIIINNNHSNNNNNFPYQPNQTNSDSYIPSADNFTKLDWDKSQQGILLSEDIERIDKETGQIQLHEVIKDQVTGFRRFRCRFCYKLYRKTCDLTRHIRIHTQQKPFQCYMCHKSFRLKSVLKNHFKSHWKLKEYSCEICNKIFNLKQTLKVHRQLHESPDKLKFVCKLCDRRFNTGFHLRYHLSRSCCNRSAGNSEPQQPQPQQQQQSLIDTDDNNPTANPIKPMIWNELLNQPIPCADFDKRKINNRLFKCNHCGKSYKFKKYLNEHLKEHLSANNTNVCQFCNKSFVTYRSMQQHLRTQHLNRRKFSCHQCPAFFITKASLIRHGLVHSNSKPYACPLCLRRFKAKIYCDRHISAKKCTNRSSSSRKKLKNRYQQNDLLSSSINPMSSLANQIESDIGGNDQSETFTAFRLEDLDMNSTQASNILVTNYVNEFSSFPSTEKYMIVSLDNTNSKDQSGSNQQNYYASNILLDDSSLLDLARNQIEVNQSDQSENIMSLLDNGQIGVTPVDIGSLFAVQGFNGNITTQLVDGTIQSGDIDYSQSQENIYYYQTLNEIPTVECGIEPPKSSLADKFPILKASLFSDDELSNPKENRNLCSNGGGQFIISSSPVAGSTILHPEIISPIKFYHGCANCDQQFKDSLSLVEHVKSQHKIRRDFTCNVCHKAFSAKLSLWAHSKTHIDSRSFGCFVCIACNQRFISVPSLSRHVRMQHNDNLNLYRCTHCNKVYKTTRELDSHVKQLVSDYDALIINNNNNNNSNQFMENVHSNPVANSNNSHDNEDLIITRIKSDVDIDGMIYFSDLHNSHQIAPLETSGNTSKLSLKELLSMKETKELLSSSSSSSMGLKNSSKKAPDLNKSTIDCLLSFPYSCSICHKGFNRASNLQQHLSVHTKLRPYQCSKCPKRFRHRCSLKTHEATKHSSVTKLLRCHLCLKLLRSQIALKNHLKLHVREYSVHCKICYKGFDVPEELSQHVDEKHGDGVVVSVKGEPRANNEETTSLKNKTAANELKSHITPTNKEITPEIPKKLIKCLSCSFIFNTKAKYDSHFCVGSNSEKPHLNRCCEKTFESTSQFLYHVQEVHNQLIQYNCAQCNILFAQESSYVNHQKSIHHL